ncbi:MAG: DEAD/DEAH box helicase family protein [Opitutales bacterium]|nr:DEAD/DEAH box helicase family protein [Opitutales bacterium]MCH8541179.1 DEAD/DEAH box helicase family protein [Opitutales bacterium]
MVVRIDPEQKTLTLSIGEFSRFRAWPGPPERGQRPSLSRAREGSEWHRALQEQVQKEEPNTRFEVTVSGRIPHQGWTIELQGRVDQLLHTPEKTILREIKTITTSLPAEEEELRNRYPEYFLQLAAYERVASANPDSPFAGDAPLDAELLFLETATGFSQRVPLSPADQKACEQQFEQLVERARTRQKRRHRLENLETLRPFAHWREGQESCQRDLWDGMCRHRFTLLEAPTGFGKTALAWEAALRALKEGLCQRVVFLSSKTNGQWQAEAELKRLLETTTDVPYIRFQNKKRHCINDQFHCFREACHYLRGNEKWRTPNTSTGLHPEARFSLEEALQEGQKWQICPYEVSRAGLSVSDLWIADTNYIFSPANQTVFTSQPDFQPRETLLIIDEAHQLPERTAGNWSLRLSANRARDLFGDFTFSTLDHELARLWEQWVKSLARLRPSEELSPEDYYDLRETASACFRRWEETGLPEASSLAPASLEQWDQLALFLSVVEQPDLQTHLWSPAAGELEVSCLDASLPTGQILRAYGSVLFLSATVGPPENFVKSCGLKENEVSLVRGQSPWRREAYEVAIDLRVDTTFRHRQTYLPLTAETLHILKESENGPVVVFFPSFAYAQAVAGEMENSFSQWRISTQPRHGHTDQRGGGNEKDARFLEEALHFSDFLFLVLGSRFTESIDALGGRVSLAVVVSPALPQVNPIQKARLAQYPPDKREEAVEKVYRLPGMRKVNQAIGRLVRRPGEQTKVLLHCQRFQEEAFTRFLHPDFFPKTLIETTDDLVCWGKKGWKVKK